MKEYFILLLILVVGCETAQLETSSIDEITLSTDKELYHSGEIIHITAGINSPAEIENVTIRFYGIYSGRYRLDQTKVVDLHEGENNVTLDYNAPRCYGCSGISPGTYQISTDVIFNGGSMLNSTVDVEIRQ